MSLIARRGGTATLVRRTRVAIGTDGRETEGAMIESRDVRAIVASRTFAEDTGAGGEITARSYARLAAEDVEGVDAEAEAVTLTVGARTWRVVEIETPRLGVARAWIEYDD